MTDLSIKTIEKLFHQQMLNLPIKKEVVKMIDNIYKKKGRINLLENDEISPEEEGFMLGYSET